MSSGYSIGIDIGGTTTKIGIFSRDGRLRFKAEVPTDKTESGKRILPNAARTAMSIMSAGKIALDDVVGAGIGVPGPVRNDGTVNRCVNLGWGVIDIEGTMAKLMHMPVKAANDANLAALGEAWMGAGRDSESLVMITLGTGVGGGIIEGQKILKGCEGAAGEIGHIIVNPGESEACSCGRHGCLEQYVSAKGIVRLAKKRMQYSDSILSGEQRLSAKKIYDAARLGDSLAKDVTDEAADYLGRAIANISDILNPEAVILGGGVSRAGEDLRAGVQKSFEKYVFHACKNTKILLAYLSNDAGIYGGARLALENAKSLA